MRRILAVCMLVATTFAFVPAGPAAAAGEPLTGKVTTSGTPVQGVQVIAQVQGQAQSYSSITDINGDYAITAPDGTYTVQVFSMTYLPINPVTITLDAANPQVLDLALFVPPPPPPPPTPFTVTGRLVDNAGNGVPGTITATAVTPFGPPSPTPPTVQATLADGTFSIDLPGGTWRIAVSAPGLVGTATTVTTTTNLGDIVMSPDAVVTGTVRDSNGNPVVGAEVVAFGSTPTTIPPAYTDAAGTYTLSLGGAGSWSVTARKIGFAFEQTGPPTFYPIGITTVDFLLLREGRVAGQVLSPSGTPVANTFVQLQAAGAFGTGFAKPTDANGEYFFDVRPGNYTLNVNAGSLFQPVAIAVTVTELGVTTQNVQLVAASSVALRTGSGPLTPVGNTGIAVCPAPGIVTTTFNVCDNGAAWSSFSFANPDGIAPLGSLAPGNYNVTGFVDFGGPTSAQSSPLPVSVVGTDTLTCTLYMDASSTSGCTGGTPPPPPPPPPSDTDGIDTTVENDAPNSGDGNGDGTADSSQPHVASTPDPTGGYVTVAAPNAQYPLSNVTAVDPATLPTTPPAGVTGQSALVGFEVGLPAGVTTATVDVYLDDPGGVIDSYWKYDAVGGWTDATSLATFAPAGPGRTKATLSLADGGFGDQDGSVDGKIVDPGVFTARGPYTVRVISPILDAGLRSARNGTTVPFLFQVRDTAGRPVTLNVVSPPSSTKVTCPRGLALPLPSLALLPATTYTTGSGNWYAGWRATKAMKGSCQAVTIGLDDGSTLRYVIKVT